MEIATGRPVSGAWALRLMMWLLVYLPFLTLAVFCVFGLFGALVLALFR